jgi:hypothetical protein
MNGIKACLVKFYSEKRARIEEYFYQRMYNDIERNY